MNIWEMTSTALMDAFASGTLSPVEAMEATLARVSQVNPALNAFFVVRADEALAAARESEKRWRAGTPVGALDGLPVSVKDSIAVAGWPYWRGTLARKGTVSSEDAPPAARLKEAGAIIFAKTTMPDFGLLPAGVSSAHGITRNPWNPATNTGGSSAGAAAAVASGMGSVSIGSDLAGSVRLPASHCGLFTLKPSTGAVPHMPVSTTRVAGPLTRTVADAALALSVIARPDPRTSEPGMAVPAAIAPKDVRGLRIGLLSDMGCGLAVEPAVAALIDRAAALFQANGAEIVPMPAPLDFDLLGDLNRYFAVRAAIERDELPAAKRRQALDYISRYCDMGDAVTAKDYLAIVERLERAKRLYREALSPFDFVISPTMPVAGFAAEALGAQPDAPIAHIGFTALANQVGWPAASICCGFSPDGLPVGLQITGTIDRDVDVLALSAWYEQARGFEPGFPDI